MGVCHLDREVYSCYGGRYIDERLSMGRYMDKGRRRWKCATHLLRASLGYVVKEKPMRAEKSDVYKKQLVGKEKLF